MASSHLGALDNEVKALALDQEVPVAAYSEKLHRASISMFGLVPQSLASAAGTPVLSYGAACAFTLTGTNPKQHVQLPTAVDHGSRRIAIHIESKEAADSYLVIEPPPGETIEGSSSPIALVMPQDSVVLIADASGAWHIEHISTTKENTNGFFSRAETTLSFDDGTRILTLAPAGTEFLVFSSSRPFVLSGSQNIQIADTYGLHFCWIDSDGVIQTAAGFDERMISSWALVAVVYWNTADAEAIVVGDERHGHSMPTAVHQWAHDTLGTLYGSGLGLTGLVVDQDGDDGEDAQFGHESGLIHDEDLALTIGAKTLPATVPVLYRDGAAGNWRKFAAGAYPLATTGTGRAAYNEWTGATWQLTEIGNNDFGVAILIATNDITNPVMAIVGQGDYPTKSAAQDAAPDVVRSLRLGGLEALYTEFTEIGVLIFQTSNTSANAVKSAFVSTAEGADYIDLRGVFSASSGAAASPSDIKPFILMPSVYAAMEDDETILDVIVPETFTIPAGGPQSSGRVWGTTATASTVIAVQKNGVDVMTLTFASSATAATVAVAADVTFVAGTDRLSIVGPATADATLAGFTLAIRGIR